MPVLPCCASACRHEDGINYNFIMPDLIVGSCLQGPEDADRLAAAGVTTVYSLQVGLWRARCGAPASCKRAKGLLLGAVCVTKSCCVCVSIAKWF